jgi:sodium-dependent phosphate transporter
MGAIFAGLGMAPVISGCFASIIFLLIKFIVHMRRNPVPWSVYSSPLWFLVAGTICVLSIVYKGSPNLGLSKKPGYWIAGVTVGSGAALCLLSALFFVPYVHARVIKKDHTLKWWMIFYGPLLFKRPAPTDASEIAVVPNYAVVQDDYEDEASTTHTQGSIDEEKAPRTASTPAEANEHRLVKAEATQLTYKEIMAQSEARHREKLLKSRGPLGWGMRFLRDNPMGAGEIYEWRNIVAMVKRIPAIITVGLLYGAHYDIHGAQSGIAGTPEGERMKRVYDAAEKYPNEVEHTYSFIQIITACTASFAHGANDIGNSVGPWAAIYSAWSTGSPAAAKAPVPVWQLAVLALCISAGLVTYGYNIMKGKPTIAPSNRLDAILIIFLSIVMGNKITYHSPSRGSSMEMGAAITVLVFSQYSLPVSTSMCITGATVGVGLCNGTLKAVNFQRVGLLLLAWIMTIPIAGTIGGCLMGLFINSPHFAT